MEEQSLDALVPPAWQSTGLPAADRDEVPS
jgi:hypothetical protein